MEQQNTSLIMAQTTMPPASGVSFQRLPLELQTQILEQLPDVTSLHNLTLAYPDARTVYKTFARSILTFILTISTPQRYAEIMRKVLCADFYCGRFSQLSRFHRMPSFHYHQERNGIAPPADAPPPTAPWEDTTLLQTHSTLVLCRLSTIARELHRLSARIEKYRFHQHLLAQANPASVCGRPFAYWAFHCPETLLFRGLWQLRHFISEAHHIH